MSQTFLVVYGKGSQWRSLVSMQDAPIPAHFTWVMGQHQAGTLVLAGPMTEDTGTVAIVRSDSADSLKALLNTDPAIVAGHFCIDEIKPFRMLVDPVGGSS